MFICYNTLVCSIITTNLYCLSFFFLRDGKIILHDKGSEYSVGYYGHNQEVNCIDCKGGVIVSGSRDKTAKVSDCVCCSCFHFSKYRYGHD